MVVDMDILNIIGIIIIILTLLTLFWTVEFFFNFGLQLCGAVKPLTYLKHKIPLLGS